MLPYKSGYVQRKKKEALRRLSQSGKKAPASARRTSSSFMSKGAHSNPFFAALGAAAAPPMAPPPATSDNVFFQQLSVQRGEGGSKPVATATIPGKPLSYAAAVKGKPVRSAISLPAATETQLPMMSPVKSSSVPSSSTSPTSPSSTSLHLKGVPAQFNNESFLYDHFSQFGTVDSIKCYPEKRFAHVRFLTRDEAASAKKHGQSLSKDTPPITIFWHSGKSPRTPPGDSMRPSVFNRLGTKGVDPRQHDPPITAGMKRRVSSHDHKKDDNDVEYVPTSDEIQYQQEGDDNDDNEMEEINEGKDSVLTDLQPEDESKMDTIARAPKHPYYLRSLHQPEYGGAQNKVEYALPALDLPRPSLPKGKTAQDLFEVLDARDKEIRKGIVKDTSLAAKAKVGCCPDMCPEKERYEREYQRRLSIFEIDQTKSTEQNPCVDHSLAIKEYSRAAADKDEPLPHELRPLPVLIMTMDHIATVLMDIELGTVSEWYNFIWDRMRSIATDIVYQQLCEPDCATLLERFARFHILCSYILCEEETHVFDPKMNTETIGRHIQSLKQTYQDLLKKGITCENEAEFCCYDILLHVNDGTSFSKVEQYSQDIRNSKQVKFALDVAQSIDSNNFVRFFKLVRKSTFLCSCILHQYFNQVRLRALQTLSNSHSPGVGKIMHFLLSDLTRMLAFSCDDETAEFCDCVGLNINKDKVQFQRGLQIEHNNLLVVRLDDQLISSKNALSFGEVVYGGPLPPAPRHIPHCSFTAAVNEEVCPPKPQINEEDLVAIATEIQNVVLPEEIKTVAEEFVAQAQEEERNHIVNEISGTVLDILLDDVVGVACKEIIQDVLNVLLHEREQRDLERSKDLIALEVANSVSGQVILSESSVVAMETIKEAIVEAKIKNCAIEEVALELVGVVSGEVAVEVAKEAIKYGKEMRKSKLGELETQLKRFRLKQYWNRWLEAWSWCQHIRKTVSEFPSTGPLVSLSVQLDHMMSSAGHMTPSHDLAAPSKRKRLDSSFTEFQPSDWEDLLSRKEELFSAIDFRSLYETLCPRGRHGDASRQWNLVVVGEDCINEQLHWAWLKSKLNVNDYVVHDSLLKVFVKFILFSEFQSAPPHMMSSIFLALTPPTTHASSESYASYVIQSVTSLASLLPLFIEIPLVILTPSPLDLIYQLDILRELGTSNFSSFSEIVIESVVVDQNDWMKNVQNLIKIIGWSLERSPELPRVQWTSFEEYIYQVLNENFVKHVMNECKIRDMSNLQSQDPDVIILLFNDVIQFLIDCLTPPPDCVPVTVRQLPVTTNNWIPPDPCLMSRVVSSLNSVKLPRLQSCDINSVHDCMKYFSTTTNSVSLLSRIKLLLKDSTFIPWAQIILIVVNHKLDDIDIPKDTMVGVPHSRLQYKLPTDWVLATVDTILLQTTRSSSSRKRSRRHSDPVYQLPPVRVESRLNKTLQHDTDGLNVSLQLEITDSIEYQKSLERLLSSSPSDELCPSLNKKVHKAEELERDLEDHLVTLEHEIKSLRWKERMDCLKLNSAL